MLPIGTRYPNSFDDDSNLLLARDSLKVRLGQDYHPGDQMITAESSVDRFPPTGVITLIDHCDPEHITSLYYETRTGNTFGNLALTPGSGDTFKSKLSSVITQQLDALHHNNIKDSVFAIQAVLGTLKDDNQSTLFGRLNRLKRVALAPRAWFEVDVVMGLAPLTVTFTSLSTGTSGAVGDVSYFWDFGDGTRLAAGSTVTKTYLEPGIYSVTLEVTNIYGTDRVVLHDVVRARPPAPDEVKVSILPQPGQSLIRSAVRTTVNQYVVLEAPENAEALDPIVAYTWDAVNGEITNTGNQAKAIFDAGGLFDVSVRVDTKLGSFRISSFPNMVDVIEPTNLWLWLSKTPNAVQGFEYGLSSETFKTKHYNSLHLGSNNSFLTGQPNETLQKKEFWLNNLFLTRDGSPSGFQGESVLMWAGGRNPEDSPMLEKVRACSFNAFLDMYSNPYDVTDRPWNWAGFAGTMAKAYLICGNFTGQQNPGSSLTNDTKSVIDFNTMETNTVKLHRHNYTNGSQDLKVNATSFDKRGEPLYGHFSRHRTTWLGDVGFMVRSAGQDEDYRFKSFYKTDGTIAEPFINITKLLDLPEPKAEGQLLGLGESVYFLSGSGDVFAYSDYTNTWEVGNAHATLFHQAGTFLATSDKDRRAYISFGSDAFVKYNALDSTFTTLGHRPSGEQWLTSVY